jgi:shikimate dehydrogenase
MRLFGLIGYPLTHSFSEKYFTEKFEKEGLTDCRYELFPLASINELPGILDKHPELEGLNVQLHRYQRRETGWLQYGCNWL